MKDRFIEHTRQAKWLYASTNSENDIADALAFISPDLPRDDWARILMAIKHELGDAGRGIADHWSAGGQSYSEKDFADAWRSCKPSGNGSGAVTIGTLFYHAQQGGYTGRKASQLHQRTPPPKPAETEAEAAQRRQKMRDKAQASWDKGKPATSHPYTTSKGLDPDGLRVSGDTLLVPVYDADRQLVSVQIIQPDGKKLFKKGCPVAGCYYPIGKPTGNTLVIAEGWATSKSIHLATGLAVAVAFSSGNLGNVARLMREKRPGFEIILAPDNDISQRAVHQAEAAARQYGCLLVVPQFAEDVTGTDFDDLRQGAGLDEVKQQIMGCRYRPVFEPVTKTAPATVWPGFPLEALGPVLSEAAQAIARMVQTPAHLAGQSVLAAAALAVQGRANVAIDNRTHPLSLFCLTIGESGERKSGADYQALRPHREWERCQHIEARGEAEAYRNELDTWKLERQTTLKKDHDLDGFRAEPLAPVQPVFICEEPTLEGLQKSFRFGLASQGLFSDEGALFFGGHAMNPDNAMKTMAGLSKFWDGAPIKRTRAASGESWAGFNRRLSCHLMVQPVIANDVLADPLMQQQGILARFLIASGNHLFGQRPYQNPDPQDLAAIARYHALITGLLNEPWKTDEDGALCLDTIKPTAQAMALWIQAYNLIEAGMINNGDYETIRAAASKSAENIARLAGVMAVFAGQAEIDTTTMGNAITLGDYFLEQYLLHTQSGQQFKIEDRNRCLLEWLQARGEGEIHIDLISKNAPANTGVRGSVDRVRAIMQRLVNTGAVRATSFNNKHLPSGWELC